MEGSSPTKRRFVLAVWALLGVVSFLMIRPFFGYLVMGAVFAYIFFPAQKAMERILPRKGAAAGVLLVFIFTLVLAPLALATLEIFEAAQRALEGRSPKEVLEELDAGVESVFRRLGLPPPPSGTSSEILLGALTQARLSVAENLPDLLSVSLGILVGIVIMGFVIYYGLLEGPRLIEFVLDVLPLSREESGIFLGELRRTLDAVLFGQLVLSFLSGAFATLGYLIFGIPNAFFWGFVTFLFALLPIVGSALIWIPASLWLVGTGSPERGLGLALFSFLLIHVLEHFLRPHLVGGRAGLHPILVLLGAIGGIEVFGFVGFVVGPVVLALFVATTRFWGRFERKEWGAERISPSEALVPHGSPPASGAVPDQGRGEPPSDHPQGAPHDP